MWIDSAEEYFTEDGFDMKLHYGPTVTIAEISVELFGVKWVFSGESKKHPNDNYDRGTGEAYAISRALRNGAEVLKIVADDRLQ